MGRIFIKGLLVCCLAFASWQAVAQASRSGEGLSRQMTALKNMLESFRGHVDGQMSDLDDRIDDVEDDISLRQRCENRRNDPSLYLPTHSDADSRGCVSVADLGGGNGSAICGRETLVSGGKTCNDCSDAGGVPVDIGGRNYICQFTPSNYRPQRSDPQYNCPSNIYRSCPAYTTALNNYHNNNACPVGYSMYRNYLSSDNSSISCNSGYPNLGTGGSCTPPTVHFANHSSRNLPSCSYRWYAGEADGTGSCRGVHSQVGCI